MTSRWIIGLASGSSVDGVDAALLEVKGVGLGLKVSLLHSLHQPYGQELRDLILRTSSPKLGETREISLLHRLLGETFAAAARQVADRASLSLQRVQCLGCPGHTLWHEPEGRFPSTLSVGMAAVVAERTGITTVSDFRPGHRGRRPGITPGRAGGPSALRRCCRESRPHPPGRIRARRRAAGG